MSNFYEQIYELQQEYYELLGHLDWIEYNENEEYLMKRCIGFALFGQPTMLVNSLDKTGYDEKQNEQIDYILQKVKRNHSTRDKSVILFRTIFIVCRLPKEQGIFQKPLFVTKKCDKTRYHIPCNIFIDDSGRVYQSWTSYLKNNELPKCEMFCPKNGQYRGKITNNDENELLVILERHNSPASSTKKEILNELDTTGTVASVGSTFVLLANLIPAITFAPAILTGAAVTGAVVGIYGAARSISRLADRRKHQQDISLKNSESRACWLNVATGVVATSTSAATGVLAKAARNGTVVKSGTKLAFNVLSGVNVIGSGTNIANMTYHVGTKLKNSDSVTALEVFQLASSVLFFHNSVIGFKTAGQIISDTQASTLQQYSDNLRSNRHRKLFRKAQLESRRIHGEEMGNNEIIAGIRKITDTDNFFARLARTNKDLNKTGARYVINSEGKVSINSVYIVDPMEFSQIPKADRLNILKQLPAPQTMTPAVFEQKTLWLLDCIKSIVKQFIFNDLQLIGRSDIDVITIILNNCTEIVVTGIMKICFKFLDDLEAMYFSELAKLYPLVSRVVAILQFVWEKIKIYKSIEDVTTTDIEFITKICFDKDTSVSMIFIDRLKADLHKWITSKKVSFTSYIFKGKCTGIKELQCNTCGGIYFS